ncbi:MAG TPA: hypothetical protein VEA38_11655 [Terriglobales bacterium]|nr:hypothetical protein [Terriglobales bacterium]
MAKKKKTSANAASSTSSSPPKHPYANHPQVGVGIDHKYSNRSVDPETKRVKVKQSADDVPCTKCGMDAAWHELTPADYTGTPEELAAYKAQLPKPEKE